MGRAIRTVSRFAAFLLFLCPAFAAEIRLDGLRQPVEILRDRWGVPHIYAQNTHDLFFAQGYMAARDRLFQIDLWRRAGTGKLAEILGPRAPSRATAWRARCVSAATGTPSGPAYGPDTREIVTAFTAGINAYIRSLERAAPARVPAWPATIPEPWAPEDCLARVAGLLMTRNLTREVARAVDARRFGLELLSKIAPPDPPVPLEIPKGLDLADITPAILRRTTEVTGPVALSRTRAATTGWWTAA